MKLIFLFIVLFIGLVYDFIPYDSAPIHPFLFTDTGLPFKTWVYFVCEHLVLIMLTYVIAYEARIYRFTCKVFFAIQVGDFLDYLLTYNTKWFGFVSFNLIAFVVFACAIVYELNDGQ